MKMLPLTNKSDRFALVDADLHDILAVHAWHQTSLGYCARYDNKHNARRMVYMHRQLLITDDAPRGSLYVDHINGNKLDNRTSNLRLATKAQNMRNRGPTRVNTSGYKGVCYHAQSSKWRAYIKTDYKQLYLGLFENPRDAALAYNEAALRLHGDFAYLNPI